MIEEKQNLNVYRAWLDSYDLKSLPCITVSIDPFKSNTHSMSLNGWKCRIVSNRYAPKTNLYFYRSDKYGIRVRLNGFRRNAKEIFDYMASVREIWLDFDYDIKGSSTVIEHHPTTKEVIKIVPVEMSIDELLKLHKVEDILRRANELDAIAARDNPIRKNRMRANRNPIHPAPAVAKLRA